MRPRRPTPSTVPVPIPVERLAEVAAQVHARHEAAPIGIDHRLLHCFRSIQSRGYRPHSSGVARIAAGERGAEANIRDAIHEACHALEANVKPGLWDREVIHAKMLRTIGRSRVLGAMAMEAAEIRARAVEQIACASLGVDCGTVDHWAFISQMEALKYMGLALRDDFADAVRAQMQKESVKKMAERIVALRPYKPRTTNQAAPSAEVTQPMQTEEE